MIAPTVHWAFAPTLAVTHGRPRNFALTLSGVTVHNKVVGRTGDTDFRTATVWILE